MCAHNTELGVQTTAELDPEAAVADASVGRDAVANRVHDTVLVALLGDDDDAAVRGLAGAFPDPPDEAEGVGEPGAFNNRLCGAPGGDGDAGPTGQSRRLLQSAAKGRSAQPSTLISLSRGAHNCSVMSPPVLMFLGKPRSASSKTCT